LPSPVDPHHVHLVPLRRVDVEHHDIRRIGAGGGRLVDDSIVELEAISRHYNLRKQEQTKIQATLEAAQEVAGPIFVSTLTTVIVFLPIVFLTGIAKLLFIPLTITIAVALFGSFFVSRTVTPLMCLRYLPPEKLLDRNSRKIPDRIRVRAYDALEAIDTWYEHQLRRTLEHRKFVIGAIAIAGVLSFGLIKFIGTEFFPEQDESQFTVTVKLPWDHASRRPSGSARRSSAFCRPISRKYRQ